MIKLFRKVRQQMLSENKFSQYLLYAIGEIILVVIGILIALQINTWNNNRIALKNMNSFLHSIKEDLKTDTLAFNLRIDFYKETLEAKQHILSLTKYDSISTDSLAYIIIPQYGNYNLNSTTFNKITNLGKSEISKNDSLSKKIYNYYTSSLEIFNSIIDWEIDFTNTEANYWFYGQNKYEMKINDEFPQFQNDYLNRQNLIEIITDPKGRNYLMSDYERKQRVFETYEHMKNIATELIIGIENELTTK